MNIPKDTSNSDCKMKTENVVLRPCNKVIINFNVMCVINMLASICVLTNQQQQVLQASEWKSVYAYVLISIINFNFFQNEYTLCIHYMIT